MQHDTNLIFRKAKEADIPNIVKMLADDELGSKREDYKVPLPKSYYDAFQNIFQDKNQELIIFENFDKKWKKSACKKSKSTDSGCQAGLSNFLKKLILPNYQKCPKTHFDRERFLILLQNFRFSQFFEF